MNLKTSAGIIFLTVLLFTGCTKSGYFLKSQAPDDLNGFLGFRWSTPMEIVDNQLTELSDAEAVSSQNDISTSSYTNISFMGRKTDLCDFKFDHAGLKQTRLLFNTTPSLSSSDVDYFRNKLTAIYGLPVQMTRPAYQKDYSHYIEGYYWLNGRLSLTLMPGGEIIVRACRDNSVPPDSPPSPAMAYNGQSAN